MQHGPQLNLDSSIHGDEVDDTNDQLLDISNHHVQGVCEKLAYSGEAKLQEVYIKLKQRFEGTFEDIFVLPSATPIVDKDQPVQPSATESTPI